MYQVISSGQVGIKVYDRRDWRWLTVDLCAQDVKYLEKMEGKRFSPTLEQSGRKFALRFAFRKTVVLSQAPESECKVVTVDLGITYSAVCSVLAPDGTVQDCLFIKHKREKDHQMRLLNRRKKMQRQHHTTSKKIWSKINNLNTQIANDTVNRIVAFAQAQGAGTIIMEYLAFKGKRPRSIRERYQLWAKRAIHAKLLHKAHGVGIRVRTIHAWGTSRYAFDGSGRLQRHADQAELCTFATGKQYHSDLNASYNIGARYYLNALQKTIPAKAWSAVEAKVPSLTARTQRTLAVYRSVLAVLSAAV